MDKSVVVHIKRLEQQLDDVADPGTKDLMSLWKEECRNQGRVDVYLFALAGCVKAFKDGKLADVYLEHHCSEFDSNDREFWPPEPLPHADGVLVEYTDPGALWKVVAQDSFHMMHVLLVSLVMHNEAPTRWFWETILITELQKYGEVDQEERDLGMMVCLVESAMTDDRECIQAVARLKSKGLLSIKKLAEAEKEHIFECVRECGIGNKCATFLQNIGRHCIENNHGKLPRTFDGLCEMMGIGPKAANVGENEVFGCLRSIAVDRHVHDISAALGYHVMPFWRNTEVDHVETSLRRWVSVTDYRLFNPVVGGMAQLLTGTFRVVKDKMDRARTVMVALGDHIHRPYHVELIWFCIGRIREYYIIRKKTLPDIELLKPRSKKSDK